MILGAQEQQVFELRKAQCRRKARELAPQGSADHYKRNMTEIRKKRRIQGAEHRYGFIFGAPLKALNRKLWQNCLEHENGVSEPRISEQANFISGDLFSITRALKCGTADSEGAGNCPVAVLKSERSALMALVGSRLCSPKLVPISNICLCYMRWKKIEIGAHSRPPEDEDCGGARSAEDTGVESVTVNVAAWRRRAVWCRKRRLAARRLVHPRIIRRGGGGGEQRRALRVRGGVLHVHVGVVDVDADAGCSVPPPPTIRFVPRALHRRRRHAPFPLPLAQIPIQPPPPNAVASMCMVPMGFTLYGGARAFVPAAAAHLYLYGGPDEGTVE
ncbi:hypothetical protein C8J57DRAFT_1673387 [Mycena rebaudengoi]|nr:hypothetical protein C8J57DRAFT_1673387 [Mycena rebaudengoi]